MLLKGRNIQAQKSWITTLIHKTVTQVKYVIDNRVKSYIETKLACHILRYVLYSLDKIVRKLHFHRSIMYLQCQPHAQGNLRCGIITGIVPQICRDGYQAEVDLWEEPWMVAFDRSYGEHYFILGKV
jgi:hypothetical protein